MALTDWSHIDNGEITHGLANLGNQINRAFPHRDCTSDGGIGDYQHQQETSGHNPDDTRFHNAEWDGDSDNRSEIRAIDVDSNFGDGVDAQAVVDHLRKLSGLNRVIRYMIYNRKMYHERNGFSAVPYTGASPHTEHIHFSGAWSDASDENTSFDFRLGEVPVALTQADKDWISSEIAGILDLKVGHPVWGSRTLRNFLLDMWGVRDVGVDPSSPASTPEVSKITPASPWGKLFGLVVSSKGGK